MKRDRARDPVKALKRVDSLIDLSRELQAANRHRHAIGALKRAVQIAPRDARAAYTLAIAYAESGDHRAAIARLRQGIRKHPGDAFFYGALAKEVAEADSPGRAIRYARRAAELQPRFFGHHERLALILVAAGRGKEATRSFRRALKLKPGVVSVLLGLGNALYGTGQYVKAIEVLQEYLKTEKSDPVARARLANSYAFTGDLERAERQARLASRWCPDAIEAHFNTGTVFLEAGSGRAVIHLRRAASIDDGNSDIWCNLSAAYLLIEEYGRAGRAALRATALDPGDARAWCNLGDAMAGKGLWHKALLAYERAVQEDVRGITRARSLARRARSRVKKSVAHGRTRRKNN